jgi:deoxyribose-phosphate aldolase
VIQQLVPWLDPAAGLRPGIAHLLDYTLLTAEATRDDILRLCDEAVEAATCAVCVNGAWVATCVDRLRGTGVRVAAVVGFPLGAGTSAAKAAEAAIAVADGAVELELVLPLGRAKAGEWPAITDDVAVVVSAAGGSLVKAIVESAILDPTELAVACRAAVSGGASFVKTSTGFHAAGGATVDAVRWMRAAVGPSIGVKAAGGIRTMEQALAMIAAGANRLGLSSLSGLRGVIGPGAPSLGELLRLTPTGMPG